MKRLFLSMLALVPAAVWAQEGKFTVQVKIGAESAPAKAYLIYPVAGNYIIDSAVLSKGSAQFSGTIPEPVSNAQLVLDHHGVGLVELRKIAADMKVIYLEKGALTITSKDSAKTAVITGSKLNDDSKRYLETLVAATTEMQRLDAQYGVASANKNKPLMDSLVARYNEAGKQKKELQLQFIRNNPGSYLSLLLLQEYGGGQIDAGVIEPMYKNLKPAIVKTPAGERLSKAIATAKATAIGAMAPAFTQNDVNDKPVSLAEFRGKYVLLDFWASWCGPCRKENPNVVKAYQQYKEKNFTVLGVSLDRPGKKDDWVAAIKADSLEWAQVSDLNYGDNVVAKLYGVNSIPQNFLIDPTGKIIARNLRGEALNEKLAALIK